MDAPTKTVFDVVTDFFASQPTDAEMLAYEVPPEQRTRLDELIEIDNTSRLTAAQREELGDYRFVEDILARVRAKIRQSIEQNSDNDSGEDDADMEEGSP